MSITADQMQAAKSAILAGTSALEGDKLGALGHALDAAVALVPDEDLAPYLTEAAVRRQKAIKAAADELKFGPG